MAREDRKVRMVGQPRPLTPLMEDLLTKVQGEAGKMGNAPAAATFPLIIASYPFSSSPGLLLAAEILSNH